MTPWQVPVVPPPDTGPDKPRSSLEVSTAHTASRVVVTAAGELDLATAPQLREALLRVFERETPAHLVVDLSGVEYADSTALGVLVGARRRVTASEGRMTVVATPGVQRVMQLTGLDQLWMMVDELPEE
jgi:anti-sigma B factor antagonist